MGEEDVNIGSIVLTSIRFIIAINPVIPALTPVGAIGTPSRTFAAVSRTRTKASLTVSQLEELPPPAGEGDLEGTSLRIARRMLLLSSSTSCWLWVESDESDAGREQELRTTAERLERRMQRNSKHEALIIDGAVGLQALVGGGLCVSEKVRAKLPRRYERLRVRNLDNSLAFIGFHSRSKIIRAGRGHICEYVT